MTIKSQSFRRFVLALGLASMVATVHGAWFEASDETPATTNESVASIARVRMSVWDVYEQEWSSKFLVAGETIKGAEEDIIELRPENSGDTIASLPAFFEAVDLNAPPASACKSLTVACTIPVPNPANPLLEANGTAVYGRLARSQTFYGEGAEFEFQAAGEVAMPTDDDLEERDLNGSVGVHLTGLNVGAEAISFWWDISRWAKGDVFVGLNEASYKVLDRHGVFKRYVSSAEFQNADQYGYPSGNITTGCAANWHTGEVYLTNFGDVDPAVNVITRQPGTAGRAYADPSRRISTAIFRSDDDADRLSTDPDRPRVFPIDTSPESIVFDGNNNMLVGHSFPHYGTGENPYWGFGGQSIRDANYLPIESGGRVVDETGAIVMTRPMGSSDPFQSVIDGQESNRLDMTPAGALTFTSRTYTWGSGPGESALLTLPNAYWEHAASGAWLEAQGNLGQPIPVRPPLGKRLHRYNAQGTPDAPVYNGASRDVFWTFTSRQGTDWIDMSSDQKTVFYTSENAYIHRFDVDTNQQLPDFGAGASRQLGSPLERFHALRILPPGDGTGGLIVAAASAILRLNGDGEVVQRYQAEHDPDVVAYSPYSVSGLVQNWYTLEVDPGGKTFWASSRDSGYLYQFDLATGRQVYRTRAIEFRPHGHEEAPQGRRIEGICVMWEYTAAQEVCDDGVDNDKDGFIDESCSPIESCSIQSPGDDDEDGLDDHNDSDCGEERPPVAVDDQFVINQGDSLTVPATGVISNDTDPDNQDSDTRNNDPLVVIEVGAAPGSLATVHVGAAMATAQGGLVTLNANGGFSYEPPSVAFHGLDTFVYQLNDGAADSNTATVTIRVRPRVANDAYSMLQMGTLSVAGLAVSPAGILVNDSVQPMHLTGAGSTAATAFTGTRTFTTSHNAQVTIQDNGDFTYTPLPAFVGIDTFVYTAHDGNSAATNNAVVTITVQDVNELVANNDGVYSGQAGTAQVRNLKANDTDPEGHPFQIVAVNGNAIAVGGTVAITGATIELIDAAGNVRITPSNSFTGLLTFQYSIRDTPAAEMTPVTATAQVSVEVAGPPVGAVDDRYTTQQNITLVVPAASGVLTNDNGGLFKRVQSAGLPGTLMVVLGVPVVVTTEHHGTATISPNGSFTYVPATNFVGTDTFKYTMTDVTGLLSSLATVWIDVTPVSTTVVTTPGPTVYGTTTTITARVTCGASQTPSVGTVTFRLGATVLAAGVPVVNGVATTPWPASTAVNTYTNVTADYTGAGSQCPGSNDDTTHQVTPAPLTITANAQTKPYGMTFSFDGNEFTTSGLRFPADTVTGVTLTSAGSAPTATVAGSTYAIVPSAAQGTGLGNYSITYVNGAMNVTRIPLTVTANSTSKAYGTLTTFAGSEFSVTGLINGNTVTSVSLSSTGEPANTPAGTSHPIVPSAAVGSGLDNYTIGYVNGTLTVTKKALTVTPLNQSKAYGTVFTFAGTEFTTAGLAAGDSVTSVTLASAGTINTATVAGGPYAITATNAVGTGLDNYTVSYGTANLSVTRVPLIITADAQTKPYGVTFSFDGNEFTTSGLLFPTDTVTGVTLTSAGAAPTATVAGSNYAIVPSAANGAGLGNYTITYVNGPLTVTAIPLTITAANRTKTYGSVATFTGSEYSTAGLVNGDAVGSVTLSSTGAPANAPANSTYPIVVSSATGSALANYIVRYVDGTLTVTPKAATVTAGSGTKLIGTSDPALTTSQVGFLASDLSAITLQTTRAGGETVGSYATTATATGGPVSNYTVSFVGGNFTITNRPPVAVNDSATTTATIPVTIAVLGNDSEPDGQPLTIASFTQPAGGTVTLSGSVFTFVANVGFFGPTTFTYTITDGFGLTSTATVSVTVQSAGGAYRTQTQGGWGTSPSGNNPGAFLAANFSQVFTAGYVQVGGTYTLRFTSAAKVEAFLPAGGKAGKLTANGVDVTTSKGGVFAGQVLALQISVAFSNAGKTRYGLASLTVQSGKLAGYTVAQVLALANSVLGGGALPSGVSISDLNDVVDKINNNFVDGTTDQGYLR